MIIVKLWGIRGLNYIGFETKKVSYLFFLILFFNYLIDLFLKLNSINLFRFELISYFIK